MGFCMMQRCWGTNGHTSRTLAEDGGLETNHHPHLAPPFLPHPCLQTVWGGHSPGPTPARPKRSALDVSQGFTQAHQTLDVEKLQCCQGCWQRR